MGVVGVGAFGAFQTVDDEIGEGGGGNFVGGFEEEVPQDDLEDDVAR